MKALFTIAVILFAARAFAGSLLICEGDSLTSGVGAGGSEFAYPLQLTNGTCTVLNIGTAGDTIAANTSATDAATNLNASSALKKTAVLFLGINDILASASSATITANLDTYLTRLRASNSIVKICGVTLMPSTNLTAGQEVIRLAVNTHIRSLAAYDYVADLVTDSRLNDASNATYFSDGLHCTAAGYAVMAGVIGKVLTDNNRLGEDFFIRAGATAGSNAGTTWANAYTNLGSVSWVRGNTYFLAGGSYTGGVAIACATNGSLWVQLKKASAAINSSDAGWSSAYGSDVATITGPLDVSNHWTLVSGITGAGTNGHGIKINPTAQSTCMTVGDGVNHVTLAGLELRGSGFNVSSNVFDGLYWAHTASAKGLSVSNCWIHEVTRNGFTTGNAVGTSWSDPGLTWSANVISETGGCLDPNQHGQGMQISYNADDAYILIERSVFRNVVGSAMISYLGGDLANHRFSRIINNVFTMTALGTYFGLSPGVIWAHDSARAATNFLVANNTVYGVGTNSTTLAQFALQSTNLIGNALVNNVWESCYFSATNQGFQSVSNNAYYTNAGAGVPSGTAGQVDGSATTFTDAAGGDFSLASGGYAVGSGVDLSSIFTTDITGATRSAPWDIGAYEFDGSEPPPPTTPYATAVSATVGTLIVQ